MPRPAVLGLVVSALLLSAASARSETTQCTVITALPYVITTQGVYCLTSDLKVGLSEITNAIEIQANNVVLDLNGHLVSNSAGPANSVAGVHAASRQNVTVRNGTIKNFFAGVILTAVDSATVEQMHVVQNLSTGIAVSGQAANVRHNVVLFTGGYAVGSDSSGYGIALDGFGGCLLQNDVAVVTKQGTGSSYGVLVSGSGHYVVDNRVSQTDFAIHIDSPAGAKYRGNLTSGTAVAPYTGGIDAGNNN